MKRTIILASTLLLGMVLSCNQDVLEKTNPNGVTVENYYKNGAELTSGVTSV